jgi:rare lipoprotein A
MSGIMMLVRTLWAALAVLPLCSFATAVATAADRSSGLAAIYHGGRTASGEISPASGLTAAHRTLPFGTMVRVTNRRNGHAVVVRINDRGPFTRGRVIDLTPAAARQIGFGSGVTPVSLDVVGSGVAGR